MNAAITLSEIEPPVSRTLKNDAMWVAIATLSLYAIVFAYQAGVCVYFHIPWELISLNLPVGFAAAAAIFGVGWSIISTVFPALSMVPLLNEDGILNCAGILTIILFAEVGMVKGTNGFVAVLLSTIVFGSTYGITVYVIKAHGTRRLTFSEFLRLFGFLAPRQNLAIISMSVVLAGTFLFGRDTASGLPQYVAQVDGKDYVMLRFYGDYVIAASYRTENEHKVWEGWHPWDPPQKVKAIIVERALRTFKLGEHDSPAEFRRRDPSVLIDRDTFGTSNGVLRWLVPYGPDQ